MSIKTIIHLGIHLRNIQKMCWAFMEDNIKHFKDIKGIQNFNMLVDGNSHACKAITCPTK